VRRLSSLFVQRGTADDGAVMAQSASREMTAHDRLFCGEPVTFTITKTNCLPTRNGKVRGHCRRAWSSSRDFSQGRPFLEDRTSSSAIWGSFRSGVGYHERYRNPPPDDTGRKITNWAWPIGRERAHSVTVVTARERWSHGINMSSAGNDREDRVSFGRSRDTARLRERLFFFTSICHA